MVRRFTVANELTKSRAWLVSKGRRRQLLQFALLCVGLGIAFFGWFLDHGDSFGWIRSVFASRYDPAVSAYTKLLVEKNVGIDEKGFSALAVVIVGDAQAATLKKIEFLASGTVQTAQGLQQLKSLKFTLQDGATFDRAVGSANIERLLQDRYLTRPLLGWARVFMLFGLAVTFVTGFAGILKQGPGT